jgi:1-acyl-sn-glycerol-3-phosphate acyltransferase
MREAIHPLAGVIAALGRLISGVQVRWDGAQPDPRQRIYFANHSSHLDFVVLWAALPSEVRARARPVAAKDYWEKGRLRPYLAQRVFRAVLLDRGAPSPTEAAPTHVAARDLIDGLVDALGEDGSLIIFPEGTRGSGETVAPFKSGIYHLARRRPDIEMVPVYIDNLNRILPKGEIIPLPLISTVTFGAPLLLGEKESKRAFLDRVHEAVRALKPNRG